VDGFDKNEAERESDEPLRDALRRRGQDGPGQTAGRFWPVACVAAEAAHDVPLPILFRRLRMIESHYGPTTSIQISGGDPTLRRAEDLGAEISQKAVLAAAPCQLARPVSRL